MIGVEDGGNVAGEKEIGELIVGKNVVDEVEDEFVVGWLSNFNYVD